MSNQATVNPSQINVAQILGNSKRLFGFSGDENFDGMLGSILKSFSPAGAASNQNSCIGIQPHPFDRHRVLELLPGNEHHSACILAKTSATVGMGWRNNYEETTDPVTGVKESKFVESVTDTTLDPLTTRGFHDVLNDIAEDYHQFGSGYMEIVRAGLDDKITGIHHIAAPNIFVEVEDDLDNEHFVVYPSDGGHEKKFARFGDKERFLKANTQYSNFAQSVSEVIEFRRASSLSRKYGYPDWLAAVSVIELVQCLTQHTFDFFNNRGVPEFLLFILGKKLVGDDWKEIEDAIKANIGLGNGHKSTAINIDDPEIKVQLEKLAGDKSTDGDFFSTLSDTLGTKIVTAHRVPPLLAGIQIPGKLGANNELPNALLAFQILNIGPCQRTFTRTLAATLGSSSLNGGLPLGSSDFELRSITDEFDLNAMGTMGSMRQTLPEAKAEGRDLTQGVKD